MNRKYIPPEGTAQAAQVRRRLPWRGMGLPRRRERPNGFSAARHRLAGIPPLTEWRTDCANPVDCNAPGGLPPLPPREVSHAALEAAAGEGHGAAGGAFQVEAAGAGTLQQWNGSAWETLPAGGALMARGDRVRWLPAENAAASLIVRRQDNTPGAGAVRARRVFIYGLAHVPPASASAADHKAQENELALALLDSRQELQRHSELLILMQEDKRRRIALDLHDGLGQSLSLIKLSVENSVQLLAQGACGAAGESLRQLVARVQGTLEELRRISAELRPSMLDDLGILPALSCFLRDFQSVCAGMDVQASLDVAEHDVPRHLHITIFRIVQEAFHNIVKHAAARHVRVRLARVDQSLRLCIEDDGCGFDPQAVQRRCWPGGGALGLLGMKERAGASGGTYDLHSACGGGTRIAASWPCGASE